MPILYDAITGAKSPNGTWTKISGPTDPVAPVDYDDDVDFSSAANGLHVYEYTTESDTIEGCTDTSTVTVEVGELFEMVNDECDFASVISVPFGVGPTLPTINYTIPNQWLSCEVGDTTLPGYCGLAPATLSTEYAWTVTNADCDNWYRITLPPYMTTDYLLDITVSSAAYPVNGLLHPKVELFTSGAEAAGDCDGNLDFLNSSSSIDGVNTYVTAFLSGTTAFYLWIRVGAKDFEGGRYNITISN